MKSSKVTPVPQKSHIYHMLKILKINQSKQKVEALKHLWNAYLMLFGIRLQVSST